MRNTGYFNKAGLSLACVALAVASLAGCTGGNQQANDELPAADMPPLEIEPTRGSETTETLKGQYSPSWFFAHDLNFNTLGRGKVLVIDAAADSRNFRGQIDADQFATFQQSAQRNELYVAETFYSRGSRGTRTDVVSIYDRETLNWKAEIVLPKANRGMSVTQKASFQLTADNKFALLYTFTPATGVAVIDLDSRRQVNHIELAGCSLIYPRGERGFATQCADGSMAAFDLDERGQVAQRYESNAFNDIDTNPMFMKSARVGSVTYFPTFGGYLQPVTLAEGAPMPEESWHFAANSDAKPSGWQVITADAEGLLYVIMRSNYQPGDHKYGGGDLWVLDPKDKRIVRKMTLAQESLSVEASHGGEQPLLLVTNVNMGLDVYDMNGKLLRTIGGFMSVNPMVLYAADMN